MNPYLSVIIPAYNEERRITETLEAVYSYLTRQRYEWEILVVIDGAKDNTLKKVQEFSTGKKNIRWINRRENKGKGFTVREGMLVARGLIRLFTDADNSTDISHFDKMKLLFEGGCDIVICSRDSKDAQGARQAVRQPFLKRLMGNLGNLFVQIVAVPGIWDTQCGFKAFTMSAAEEIFTVARVDRWGFDIEALALARKASLEISIIPAYWVDNADTHVKLINYAEVIFDTLKIRWHLTCGTYDQKMDLAGEVKRVG